MPSSVVKGCKNDDTKVKKKHGISYHSIGVIYDDVTTEILGKIGSWQWLVTFVSTALMIPSMLNQHEDMFLLDPPKGVECEYPETVSLANSRLCTFTLLNGTKEYKCNRWNVHFLWLMWIKKTWLAVCDHKMKVLSTTIICRLGLVFGCIIFGLVSDSFGRKRAIVINVLADLLFRLILTFCDSESWYNLIIFLRSIFASANFYMGLVLICEVASNGWRTHLNAIVSTPRLFASVCLVPMTNTAPNLETFNFIASISGLFLLILLRWIPESPQWLLFNRKINLAEQALLKAAKRNGIELCSDFKIRPVNHRAYQCLDESWTCVGMLTTHNIRILTLTVLVFWSVYYFVWSSLYMRIYYNTRQDYILLKLCSFIILLVFLNWCMAKKLKLKHLLIINLGIIGITRLALIFMKSFKINTVTCNFISILSLATGVIVHALILNITPRLFAINIRATIFGCCHSTGQLGTIICYLIVMFDAHNELTLMLVEAGLTVFLTFSCLLLPDVDGREMPDVMDDMDYFSELSKPLRWASQKTHSPSHEEVEIRVHSFSDAARDVSSNERSRETLPARRRGLKQLRNYVTVIVHRMRRSFGKAIT